MNSDLKVMRIKQIEWAHEYNAYARLARSPENLASLLQPAWLEYSRTKRIPDWCGVDPLRGWAFYLTRADRHTGGHDLLEGGDMIVEWEAVLQQIATHDEATPFEKPPMVNLDLALTPTRVEPPGATSSTAARRERSGLRGHT